MLTLGLRSGLGGPSSKNRSRSVADVVYSVALRCELIKIASEKTIPVANLGGEQVLCENNFPQTLFVTLQFLEKDSLHGGSENSHILLLPSLT